MPGGGDATRFGEKLIASVGFGVVNSGKGSDWDCASIGDAKRESLRDEGGECPVDAGTACVVPLVDSGTRNVGGTVAGTNAHMEGEELYRA